MENKAGFASGDAALAIVHQGERKEMETASLRKMAVVALAFGVTGCATAPGQGGMGQVLNDTFNNADPCANNARNTGVLVGALAGALIGAKLGDKDKGAILAGALIGSAAGGIIGTDIDQRRCALAKVAREYDLTMRFASIGSNGETVADAEMNRARDANADRKNDIGHIVSLQDGGTEGGHFESNSAVLSTRAERYFSAIADIYNLSKAGANPAQKAQGARSERKLLLVGHTDDTGASATNAELSERRARAVAEYLERRGIPRDQILYQGAGEVYPVADNQLETGRAQNRRVEIVELSNSDGLNKYLEARRPNYQYYRAAAAESVLPGRSAQGSTTRVGTTAAQPDVPRTGADTSPVPVSSKPRKRVVLAAKSRPPVATPKTADGALPGVAQAASLKSMGRPLDFGGTPLAGTRLAAAGVGVPIATRPLFSLISSAHASDLPFMTECTQDRPRVSGAVRALRNGATYRVAEHVPGLYGKTWTQRVNGHQIVINKVAVLASEASLAQIPELKIYANYDPANNRNPKPDVSLRPAVNTYLGEGGILYRIFTNGEAGTQCIDILYSRDGGAAARDGNIVYARGKQLYVSPFKPVIAN